MTLSTLDKPNLLINGEQTLIVEIPPSFFNSKSFYIDLLVFNFRNGIRSRSFTLNDVISFSIVNGKKGEGAWLGESSELIKPKFNWKIKKNDSRT
jgi:hypothetical protein